MRYKDRLVFDYSKCLIHTYKFFTKNFGILTEISTSETLVLVVHWSTNKEEGDMRGQLDSELKD